MPLGSGKLFHEVLLMVTAGMVQAETEGVQVCDPESCAVRLPLVAIAAGFGCDWQALAGVVEGLETTTVTEPFGAMSPKVQLRELPPLIVQLPVDTYEAQVRPPLVGSVSVNLTFIAVLEPGLLTTMV